MKFLKRVGRNLCGSIKSSAVCAGLFLFFHNIYAATPANTLIQNFVEANYTMDGDDYLVTSNVESFRVDELIDFTLVSNNPTPVSAQSPSTDQVLSFTLLNIGNGDEEYQLQSSPSVTDDFDTTNVRLFLDSNSNGLFDSLTDVAYTLGVNDPLLNPNQQRIIFIVSDVPGALSSDDLAELNFTATTKTGSGPAGTIFLGAGTGGVDAVLGPSAGMMTVNGRYRVSTVTVDLVKTQSILDPSGTNYSVPNAVITYTLTANVQGAGSITSFLISDSIPVGTTYENGSLRLNGSLLTDAADVDSGVYTGTGIQVDLGTVVSPTAPQVSFQVRIQ